VEPLTPEEVNLILSKSKRYRDSCILLMMALVGMRRGEILATQTSDIDFDNSTIRIRGKGSKERVMPIPPLVSKTLSTYLQYERPQGTPSESLFMVLQGSRRGQGMTIGGMRSLLRSRRRSTAIYHANPHRFRHTFASSMVRSGVSILVLQKMLGHARYETTLRYVALNAEDIAAEYFKALKTIETHHVKKDKGG
jgi:site-specific recombinase XerD